MGAVRIEHRHHDDRLAAFPGRCFRTAAEDEARPRWLDAATAKVPALAVQALTREVARFGGIALRAAQDLALPAAAMAPLRRSDSALRRVLQQAHKAMLSEVVATASPAPAAPAGANRTGRQP